MQVSKITIGRLYNLGNYEHVRYELTVEVPPGLSAASALLGLENILAGLNPTIPRGVPQDHDIERAVVRLNDLGKMSDDEINAQYKQSRALTADMLKKQLDDLKARKARYERIQREARSLFDDVGGAANFTDAKAAWTDFDDYDTF